MFIKNPKKVVHIVGRKVKRQTAGLTSAERGPTIAVTACMNAGGHFVPPVVIFPRENISGETF